VADSYSKIAERSDDANVKTVLEKIVGDSRRHAQMLRNVLGTFESIIKDEKEHARLLGELAKKTAEK
jgi:rubrerythrin